MRSLTAQGRVAPGTYLLSAAAGAERLAFEDLRALLATLVERTSRSRGGRA